ncbi:MAG: hypothetical protein KKF46_01190, partial [Nanoarchaeota archaeon]|nr:hypothetical protein [Nanoarchaeota archaeon]MBU2442085.1 hypothetical protein [Nanoarchaeota archaeon]
MKAKKEKINYNFAMIAIVAIVAIVALVIIAKVPGKGYASQQIAFDSIEVDQESLVGQAYGNNQGWTCSGPTNTCCNQYPDGCNADWKCSDCGGVWEKCDSKAYKVCHNGNVWWFNSCNQPDVKFEDCGTQSCQNANCQCIPTYTYKCEGGRILKIDSCTQAKTIYLSCGSNGCDTTANQCNCYETDTLFYTKEGIEDKYKCRSEYDSEFGITVYYEKQGYCDGSKFKWELEENCGNNPCDIVTGCSGSGGPTACRGTDPSGAGINMGTDRTYSGMSWTYSSAYNNLKPCEWGCKTNENFERDGNTCKCAVGYKADGLKCVPDIRTCEGTKPTHADRGAIKYTFMGTTKTWVHKPNKAEAELGACEYNCQTGFKNSAETNSCIMDLKNCGGTTPTQGYSIRGNPQYQHGVSQTTRWTYNNTGTLGRCEFKCQQGYYPNNANNNCVECTSISHCANQACKNKACTNNQCTYTNVAATCPAANTINCGVQITPTNQCGKCTGTGTKCTTGKTCQNNQCVECTTNTNCNDNNACTTDTCINNNCNYAAKCSPTQTCNTSTGNCIDPIACTDSDDGYDYYKAGTLVWYAETGEKLTNKDYCTETIITEYGCVDGKSVSKVFTCPNGCNNGACTPTLQATCIDHDASDPYRIYVSSYVSGDYGQGDSAYNVQDVCDSNKVLKEQMCFENKPVTM